MFLKGKIYWLVIGIVIVVVFAIAVILFVNYNKGKNANSQSSSSNSVSEVSVSESSSGVSSAASSSSTVSSSNISSKIISNAENVKKIDSEMNTIMYKFLINPIPEFFTKPQEISNHTALLISLLNAPQNSGVDNVGFSKQSDVDDTAKMLFGDDFVLSHENCNPYTYNSAKSGYESYGFGLESGYVAVPINCTLNSDSSIIYLKFVYSDAGYFYDFDKTTLLDKVSLDVAAKKITKSPIYKLTLHKKSNGDYFVYSFEMVQQ